MPRRPPTSAPCGRCATSGATARRARGCSAWRNTCLDERRSLARRLRLLDKVLAQPPEATTPGAAADLPGDVPVELAEALAGLAPERREAFVLTQLLGFSYEDAADAIGCPVGTIRSRVARARGDLLDLVEDRDGHARGASAS
ncbi:MAG: sigma factor-like helix-turn-helix DNA-binding protein [Acidimicrobiales bacterium]